MPLKFGDDEVHMFDKEQPPCYHLSALPANRQSPSIFDSKKPTTCWRKVPDLPLALSKHTMHHVLIPPMRHGLVVVGGLSGAQNAPVVNPQIFFHEDGTEDWKLLAALPVALARCSHSAVVVNDCELIVFGGKSEKGVLNDTLVLRFKDKPTATQIKVQGEVPPARSQHTAVLVDTFMIIFGGVGATKNYFNDMYALDLKSFTWHKIFAAGNVPVPRAYHTKTMISASRFVVYGGITKLSGLDHALSDIWIFHFNKQKSMFLPYCRSYTNLQVQGEWNQVSCTTKPPALYGHGAMLFGPKMYITGGSCPDAKSNTPASSKEMICFGFDGVIKERDYSIPLSVTRNVTFAGDGLVEGVSYHAVCSYLMNRMAITGGKYTNGKFATHAEQLEIHE